MRATIFTLLLALSLSAFQLEREVTIEGRFYFTPALANSQMAAFGYISKVRPTPEEVERERRLLERLIQEGVEREYGGWEGFRKEVERGIEETARGAPWWQKILFPPKLAAKGGSLLMEGLLKVALTHPNWSSQPIGAVGRTGIILFDEKGNYTDIPLGINSEVVWLAFSPRGDYLAVESDASIEREGKVENVGRIDLIDLREKRVLHSSLFANLDRQIAFSRDGKYLAFIAHNPKRWSQKVLRFIDVERWKVTERVLPFESLRISGWGPEGRNYDRPYFLFTKESHICLQTKDHSIECYKRGSLTPFFHVRGGGGYFDLSPREERLFDDNGREWNYSTGELLHRYPRFSKNHPLWQVRYLQDGRRVAAVDLLYQLKLYGDGKVLAQFTRLSSLNGPQIIFPDPEDRYIYGFAADGDRYISYRGGLRRQKKRVRVYRIGDLKPIFDVRFEKGSAVDGTATAERLFVSGFDSIRIYRVK
ncbi:MAG: hypothetical protein GXO19_01945 [Epsilonproteobacteria bacterium]|nr:hypothetical protein [Campylobacterota bacterium]NPA56479.1 hypothetical protein [Campylobacterota bacterium]